MKKFAWNVLKFGTLAVILAFGPYQVWKQFAEENWFRYWMIGLAPIVTVLLLLVWYLVFGKASAGKRFKRVGLCFGGLIVLFFLFQFLFQYEGSTSGASTPKYSFRFGGGGGGSEEVGGDSGIGSAPIVKSASPPGAVEVPPGAIDSPRFLGPNGDGMWPESPGSLAFDSHPPEELWRREIGEGWSSFAVAGGRAVTQEQRGDDELVTCYELATGDLLWFHVTPDSRFTRKAGFSMEAVMGGEGPRSTPTIHGDRLVAVGSTGIVKCLDLETGAVIWTRNVIADFGAGLPSWGKSSAPLVLPDQELVVITGPEAKTDEDLGNFRGPTLIAFQLENGNPAWEYAGRGSSYSSPRLVEILGEEQIVSVNGRDVTGHDPATGQEKWKFDWPGPFPKVGQPILVGEDRILVTASYNVGSFLVRLRNDEGSWSAEEVWKTNRLKTKFSSAVVHGGHAYALNEGRLTCVDLADGKMKWRGERYGYGQNLLLGDKLLVQAERGAVAIAATDPEQFTEVARLDALDAMTWNTPAMAGQYLLVRNGEEAICFRLAPAGQ